MRLKELLDTGFGDEQDYNCAERLFAGANIAYELGLSDDAVKTAGCFGGGMQTGSVCGALSGSLMALGKLVITECAHKTEGLEGLVVELFADFARKLGAVNCTPIKKMHWDEKTHCIYTQKCAAEVLDEFLIKHGMLDEKTGEIIK
ncbi:MAG: C-GCAxxG-C-C family (seleno)protein [Oscillospiraceae bacterium]